MTNNHSYVVKFLDLIERTKEEFEYAKLSDAIKVAKDSDINGRPAISDDNFEVKLLELLTSTFTYAGPKTDQYPEGSVMVMLTKRVEYGIEDAIYGPRVIPFVAGLIPVQPSAINDLAKASVSPVANFLSDPERSTD